MELILDCFIKLQIIIMFFPEFVQTACFSLEIQIVRELVSVRICLVESDFGQIVLRSRNYG